MKTIAYLSVEYDTIELVSEAVSNLIWSLIKLEKEGARFATTVMKILGVLPSKDVFDKFYE